MDSVLDFYQAQAKAAASAVPALATLQAHALKQLSRRGFPARHDEEWKYTSLQTLLDQGYQAAPAKAVSALEGIDLPPFTRQVILGNGVVQGLEALQAQLPEGVLVLPLAQAMQAHADLVAPYLGKVLHQEHGMHWLNTAMIHSGLFIYIPEGVSLDEPIAITHVQDQRLQAVYVRHVVVAAAGSQASLVETYCGKAHCNYFTNTVTEIFLAPHATLTHYKMEQESTAAYHVGQVSVKQSAHSHFASHVVSLGGKLVRSDLCIDLAEEQASCLMNGLYLPCEGQHIDHHTRVHHNVPSCTSVQDYKGILSGRSKAVFNGKVIVAQHAQHTDAKQQNKNLLLSDKAEINTKPQLEIFADDVFCTHGATVGQLDEDALFYLMTRGIPREDASRYLIQAFAKDNLERIPNSQIAQWMRDLLTQHME